MNEELVRELDILKSNMEDAVNLCNEATESEVLLNLLENVEMSLNSVYALLK